MKEASGGKTLYLHVGMHKTGTTALQKFFSLNDRLLASQGICYPELGRSASLLAHHDIANSLKGPPFPLRAPEKSPEEYLEGIRDCFRTFPGVLLSSEIFMRFVPAFRDRLELDLSQLEKLAAVADRVQVIIYLRRQDRYLESFYSQEIQHDLCLDFSEFVAARMPDYYQICQELAGFAGGDNVTVRVYDRNRFAGGTLYSDFLSALDIEQTDSFVLPGEDINPSLAPDEREFKRLVNALGLPIREVIRFNAPLLQLSQARRGAGETGAALFRASQRAKLLADCSEANRRLAADFLGRDSPGDTLFPAAADDKRAAEAVYAGPDTVRLRGIAQALGQLAPELVKLLSRAARQALLSADHRARDSAAILLAALG